MSGLDREIPSPVPGPPFLLEEEEQGWRGGPTTVSRTPRSASLCKGKEEVGWIPQYGMAAPGRSVSRAGNRTRSPLSPALSTITSNHAVSCLDRT